MGFLLQSLYCLLKIKKNTWVQHACTIAQFKHNSEKKQYYWHMAIKITLCSCDITFMSNVAAYIANLWIGHIIYMYMYGCMSCIKFIMCTSLIHVIKIR